MSESKRALYYRLFAADGFLPAALANATSVLDVGCSDGRGSELLSARGAYGVDIYRPALVDARRTGRRGCVVQADVRRLPYRTGAFDAVVSFDVIEHFEKPDALALLRELERVARRTVVVGTPRGFVAQPPTESEPWQEHRCGFEARELTDLGYQVTGVGGPAALRGEYGRFRFGPLGQVGAVVALPWTRSGDSASFGLLATKHLDG